MAEVESFKTRSLAEQYVLEKEENANVEKTKPVEISKDDDAESPAPLEEVKEDTSDVTPPAEESGEASPAASVEIAEPTAIVEETPEAAANDSGEQETSGDQDVEEETSDIKLATAPADYRFPTTNQSRHCFTRYIEYHRCIAAKGEGASECEKFAKYYRSLCPGEWVDRWNEQRENGTFPGPL